jgi:uncharacterized protein YjbI with pentapeptide repeats
MSSENDLWHPPLTPKEQQRIDYERNRQQKNSFAWTGFKGKTVWDWLQLLAVLAIPLAVALGTAWFSNAQDKASTAASERQHQNNLLIAKDQQQETALQTYLDRMSDLLLKDNLQKSSDNSEAPTVARSRTLTVLPQLNGARKAEVLTFLYEADLVKTSSRAILSLKWSVLRQTLLNDVTLNGLNLDSSYLQEATLNNDALIGIDLHNTELSHANLNHDNLQRANLADTELSHAILNDDDLQRANLSDAKLSSTNLSNSNLNDAKLHNVSLKMAILQHDSLQRANLSDSDLSGADLSNSDLSNANLKGSVGITNKQLSQAFSLRGTIMPDGSKHP